MTNPPLPEPVDPTTIHVARARTGDRESREWIIARFTPLLLAQARYRIAPRLQARLDPEDLVNETWLVALPRLDDLVPRGGRLTPVLLRFLGTTQLRIYNNLARRAALRHEARLRSEADGALAAEVTGVVSRCLRRDLGREVADTLEGLEPGEREIILLRAVEQLSNTAVAALLELRPGAAAMRYKRALEKVRGLLPRSLFDDLDP